MYSRYLKLNLPKKQSAFLWGARKTGKSTYLKEIYPNSVRYDFLNTKLFFEYNKSPWKFREAVLALDKDRIQYPIIVDEVQKIPRVMDEIHWLIENSDSYFILCGSSSRKMRQAGVNLLGGRALKYHFYPLVYPEVKQEFDLLKIFNNGLIPQHYIAHNARHLLRSYIEEYLSSEIKAEGLVRNLAAFNRFLDAVSFSHGELINYSNIARDVGVNSATVKQYYQILEDTLVGYFIYPYSKKESRRIISSVPKFYLFDVGVANRLRGRSFENTHGAEAGKSLEHYVFLELLAYTNLNLFDHRISYWRTHTGLEVDFVIYNKRDKPIPIEVKISENIHKTNLGGMKAFMKEYSVKEGYIVCMEDVVRKIICAEGEIIILPLIEFLEKLWEGEIFKE